MRLQEDLDFTTLNWVKQELDETLKQASQSLEAFVEDPSDASQMRFCATYLHQVQGTLRMVELYGAAMVVEEMERVAQALLDGQVRQKDDSYGVLMRGMMQLPDYLERLQSGHKDIPIVLLPLLNDLRSCRGEKLLSESVLFSPDLTAPLPRSAAGPERPVAELELRALANRLRTNFQTGLLNWIRERNPDEAIGGLIGTLERLRSATMQEDARRLWWVASGALEALQLKGLDPNATIKLLFGKVDREIKRLGELGEQSFRVDPPRELTKNLLYYVAHSRLGGERVRDIKDLYRLDSLMPTEQELQHAKGSLAGKNRALLDTVSSAIKEDLLRVKDALDLFLRTQNAKPEELAGQTDVLDRVADTLGMLGLGVPRRVVQEQRTLLANISMGQRQVEESTLLDIAGALLYVEASLDENIETLGGGEAPTPEVSSTELDLPHAEIKKILDAVMKEALANLQQTKSDMVAFVESPWDHAKVTQIPRMMEEISGALRMLHLDEAVEQVVALNKFIEVELLRMKRVPSSEQMDRLADALASVEYYVEATRDQRAGREKILDVTRRSLEALGYWPVPAEADEILRHEAEPDAAPAAPAASTPAAAATGFALPDRVAASIDAANATISGREALSPHVEAPAESTGYMPSLDMPGSEQVAEFVARMERGEQEITAEVPAIPQPPAPPAELRSVVEIGKGSDLADLMLGDSAAQPLSPPPPESDLAGLRYAESADASDEDEEEFDWVEIEEEVELDAPVEVAADASFQAAASEDIDDEIREVFVEEVQEEINNIGRQLPMWRADVLDLERLKPLRRSFHTLKGSGRLVGAFALGEFSWKVENMLNRVLDKTIQPAPAMQALLDHAVGALPELLAALRGEGTPTSDIAGIMAVADQIAQGEEAWLRKAEKVKVKQVRRVQVPRARKVVVSRPVELDRTLDLGVPAEFELAPAPVVAEAPAPAPAEAVFEPAMAAVVGPPMPDIEPTLREILKSELEQHLATIQGYLDQCRMMGFPMPASEPLLRAVHTMHGAISMVDLPVIGEVFGPLESYIKRLRAQEQAPDARGLNAIERSADLVTTALSQIERPGTAIPASEDLIADVIALRDHLPEPASALAAFALDMDEDEQPPVAAVEPEAPAAVPVEAEAAQAGDEQATAESGPVAADDTEAFAGIGFTPESQASAPEAFALEEELALEDGGAAVDAGPLEDALAIDDDSQNADEPVLSDLSGFESGADSGAFALESVELGADQAESAAFEVDSDATPVEDLAAWDLAFGEAVPEPEPELPTDSDVALSLTLDSVEIEPPVVDAVGLEPEAVEPGSSGDDVVESIALDSDAPESVGFAEPEGDAVPVESEAIEPAASEAAREDSGSDAEGERRFAAVDSDLEISLPDPVASEPAGAPSSASAPEFEAWFAAIEEGSQSAPEAMVGDDDMLAALVQAEEQSAPIESVSEFAESASAFDDAAIRYGDEEVPAAAATPEPAPQARERLPFVPLHIAEDPDPAGPLVLSDMDDDLLEIFVEEGADILDRSDALVARLRETGDEREAVTGLQRHLHTLKGNARAVGLAGIGDLSHAMESVLERSSAEEISLDRVAVSLLERGFDKLHHLVSRVAKKLAVGVPENMIGRFETLAAGGTIEIATDEEAAGAEAGTSVEVVAVDDGQAAAAMPEVPASWFEAEIGTEPAEAAAETAEFLEAQPQARAEAAPVPEREAPAPVRRAARLLPEPIPEEEAARPQQEMIRVRSDLLDALVNFAGEVSIYRSRLEQQMGTYRFNLVELEQTVTRLREQLRKLELETEAQVIARFQREAEESGSDTKFDPLELDRYSTIQQLSRALAESVSDLIALQGALDDLTRQSETLLLQQSRVSSELQEGLMRTRMVPFDSVVPFLRRLLRQTSDELGKRANLRIEGAQGEMDRNLLERMKAPFEHMLRNALAHGIESPQERAAAGKPEEGTVRITVAREATEVVIKVSDDGAGMDRDAIRRKAIERGLLRPDAQLSDRDLFAFILETGFSTAEQVTKIAGRGVGMDVVASEIKQLGGSLAIDSQRGVGSQFNIRLPFTLAVTQAIMVRLGDAVHAVPMSSVQGVARIARDDLGKRLQQAMPTFSYGGEEYLIHELDHLLGVVTHRASDDRMLPLLLTRTGDQRAAIRIDAVLGSREIVVKSVGPQLASVPGIFGATIMGDGSVVMILDVAPLVRRAAALREEVAREAELEAMLPGLVGGYAAPTEAEVEPLVEPRRQPLIMVVDDSITMRKVTTRVLERNDMEVVTAKDGLDAVEKLQDRVPDLVLLDIEMPRMDGYELATYMRNDSRLKLVPIIMITSRTGEKHRQRAFEIGVDRYLGKPYQEADLLRNVEETLRLSRALQ